MTNTPAPEDHSSLGDPASLLAEEQWVRRCARVGHRCRDSRPRLRLNSLLLRMTRARAAVPSRALLALRLSRSVDKSTEP